MTAKILSKGSKRLLKRILIFSLALELAMALAFVNCISSFGQDLRSDKPLLKDRLIFGGSFSLQIGTVTNIEASPIFGIWLLPRIAIAAGPSYQFYKDPFDRTNIYGVRTYLQYVVIQDINNIIPVGVNTAIFLHGEYEVLSLESDFWSSINISSGRFITHALLAGIGVNQPIGKRSSVNLMVLWALNDNNYGVYDNPEIRVGFNF